MANRIGPQMQAAAAYVSQNPGCTIRPVADAVGPSRRFGYAAVHRAIKAGIIHAAPGARRGTYSLTVA